MNLEVITPLHCRHSHDMFVEPVEVHVISAATADETQVLCGQALAGRLNVVADLSSQVQGERSDSC